MATILPVSARWPEEVPANINWIRLRLGRIHPAQHDMSNKRFANIKADVLKALTLTGCSRRRSDWLRAPSASWQQLLYRVPDRHDRWKLFKLAQYCSALEIEPWAFGMST